MLRIQQGTGFSSLLGLIWFPLLLLYWRITLMFSFSFFFFLFLAKICGSCLRCIYYTGSVLRAVSSVENIHSPPWHPVRWAWLRLSRHRNVSITLRGCFRRLLSNCSGGNGLWDCSKTHETTVWGILVQRSSKLKVLLKEDFPPVPAEFSSSYGCTAQVGCNYANLQICKLLSLVCLLRLELWGTNYEQQLFGRRHVH